MKRGRKPAELAAERAAAVLVEACAKAGQKTLEGFYNLERMLGRVLSAGGRVLLCGACMDARGLTAEEVIPGAVRSTMDELAQTTIAADKVLVFWAASSAPRLFAAKRSQDTC